MNGSNDFSLRALFRFAHAICRDLIQRSVASDGANGVWASQLGGGQVPCLS
jgi:hypothetical protein